jgi:hypothetical protein
MEYDPTHGTAYCSKGAAPREEAIQIMKRGIEGTARVLKGQCHEIFCSKFIS